MANIYEGGTQVADARFAIVVSRYNENITSKLLDAAVATLTQHGVSGDAVDIAWVPGAWEIPVVADRVAKTQHFAAVITLGCVIRGETTHDQHINQQVSSSLGEIAVRTGVPIAFGVLTVNSLEQAIHRSGGNVGNKGEEAATAALEMASLLRKLDNAS